VLQEYIRIPNVSPMFDSDWHNVGHMDRAAELVRDWMTRRPLEGLAVERIDLPGRTPLLLAELPANSPNDDDDDVVLLYGHLDKQPAMTGWREGLGPWEPVVEGARLYGRGGADDGYSAFSALGALEAVRASGGHHGRAVVLIEGSEESGSPDLPAYIDHLADRIGTPSLVVCLDSSCPTYEHLWVTTSLRGLVGVVLTVQILREGYHSGAAGGIVPSSFRLLRQLLSRIEDEVDGRLLLPELHVDIPADREAQIAEAAEELGPAVAGEYPWVPEARPMGQTPVEQLLNRTWRPSMATVGIDGAPPIGSAGNVLRPFTRVKLSFRLPPTAHPQRAAIAIAAALTSDPPDGAEVTCELEDIATGWAAAPLAPWLGDALDRAARAAYGTGPRFVGEGGTIPFMAMLGERFPDAQFLITGVLGPGSNAHGPNEFLDLPTAKRVTHAVAHVLDAHATR
jgi:acetylornithine deacetylase/succinyl-diaminopimelate desuccinylase-like protein